MIIQTDFQSTENHQEIVPMEQTGLPYVCLMTGSENFKEGLFPWHWHTAMEIDFIESGEVDFRTPEQTIHLRRGDAIFINSGCLHSYQYTETDGLMLYAHLFDTRFLSGEYNNAIDQKYIRPVLQCSGLQAVAIRSDSRLGIRMLSELVELTELMQTEPFGYELAARAALSRFWCLFLEHIQPTLAANKGHHHPDTERMKQMMTYIKDHFSERIALPDIAAAAGISPRECIRCFQRSIGDTPVNYLNVYRIQMAMQLLTRTADSVTEISEACGFSSISYFGKLFREKTGVTPSEYRKMG